MGVRGEFEEAEKKWLRIASKMGDIADEAAGTSEV
jgi:hypothetical protein